MINIHRRRNLMLSVFSESRAPRLVASALTAVVLVACGPREGRNADSTDSMAGMDTSPAAATPATGATLSDAQISHIVMTANSGDSAMGALAVSKARNAQVKEFGRMMVRDHGDANKKVWELTQRLSITGEDNDVSRQLTTDVESAKTDVNGKTGADFDRAYIDHEVQIHQKVLDALDQTLIPGAQNAELKSLLQAIRPTVSAHLERAKTLQTTVTTATASDTNRSKNQ
jgi:putative membrane protein